MHFLLRMTRFQFSTKKAIMEAPVHGGSLCFSEGTLMGGGRGSLYFGLMEAQSRSSRFIGSDVAGPVLLIT